MRRTVRSRKRHLLALVVICFGIFASALCFYFLASLETQKVRAQFRHAAKARFDQIETDLDISVDKVQDLSAFCSSHRHLTRVSFELFAREVLRDTAVMQALEWAPPVAWTDRNRLERFARAEGLKNFEIRDRLDGRMVRAADRPLYTPVLYIYPQAGNEIAFGYDDLAHNSVRREVLERAESTGELSGSGRIILAQDNPDNNDYGVLLVNPVYYLQAVDTEQPGQFLGYVEGVLRVGEIVRRYGEDAGVALTIVDRTEAAGEQQLYPGPGISAPSPSGFTQVRDIKVGGRSWRLIASPRPGAFPVRNRRGYVGGAICLLFTLMAAALMTEILGRNEKVERQVEERSRQLSDALAALEQVHRGLEESEARYRRLVEDSPSAIVVERGEKIVMANRAALEMFGFDPCHELEGRNIFDFVAEESRELASRLHQEMAERETRLGHYELRIQRRDGCILDTEVAASSFTLHGLHTIQIVLTDITQRKREEEANARLFTAIEQLREYIVITDPQGRIVYVNPAFERVTGYSREEVVGQNPRLLKSGRQSGEFYSQMWEVLRRGEAWRGRFVNRAKDGHLFTEEATISPVVNRNGELINYVAVKRDVTRELELQEQLQQSTKMDAIGRLAGGVAHDFNNMLMVIVSYAELLMESLPETDPAREQIGNILNAANRSFALTRQLLTFSRKQLLAPRVIDCNAIITETISMVRRLISEDVELRCELEPALWAVKADADQIAQLIVNLCVNSRDAMPNGGAIMLATRNNFEQQCVEISVKDTGTGIAPELQKKIFEPFFSTKQPGKGTGLGLATAYGMVQQSGGSIRVVSAPGHGATFIVSLPRCSQRESAQEVADRKALPPERGIVLVVEDEEALRKAILKQLRAHGYRALAAADGTEALAILARTRQIGVVLCDVVMPRMGGAEFARLASQKQPELRFLFMSGHPEQSRQRTASVAHAVFLPKPFDGKALLAAIAEVLPSPGAANSLTQREEISSPIIQ